MSASSFVVISCNNRLIFLKKVSYNRRKSLKKMQKVLGTIYNARIICATSLVIIFCAHNFVFSEFVPVRSCNLKPSNSCQVRYVSIDPCPEILDNMPCNYYRGTNTTLTTHFVPNFNATILKVQRYSTVLFVDLPDPTYHDRDACKFISPSCPITAGRTYKFRQTFAVLESYPPGVYTAKWKIWNESNEECCFVTEAAVV